MFFGIESQILFFLSYITYHKSLPPIPPGISLAKININPSSVIHGCPTEIVSLFFSVIFITFSHSSPALSAIQISQPRFCLATDGHLVKYKVFFLESMHAVPSLSDVLIN